MTKASAWRWGAPRLITRAQLRGYLQIEEAELQARMDRGQVSGPLWGCDAALDTARWDRHAVDLSIDRASSIRSGISAAQAEADAAFGFTGYGPAGRLRRPKQP